MKITDTGIEGLVVIEPRVFDDARGYFFESYNQQRFIESGINTVFVQDNESKSTFGVLRGLHYQVQPKGMTKLIRATKGKILDVVLDIRNGSSTYGKYFSVVLSAKNKKQLFIPKGFAHGFLVLSKKAVVNYKCDEFYSKEHESGILWNDPDLNIDWGIDLSKVILSDKDKIQPTFKNHTPYSSAK